MREILMVCYGNICRSPMAEVLLADALARRGVDGVLVTSAGTHAMDGNSASEGGVKAMARRGLDSSAHRARELTQHMLHAADLVVCMTASHADWARSLAPGAADKITTLGADVPDPLGGGQAEYESVANLIAERCEELADRIADQKKASA